jgi:hypothetical protein
MGDNPMFAPLRPSEMPRNPPAADEDWQPMPAPNGAKPDLRHPQLGDPSTAWRYINALGELEGYVCRFETETSDGPDKEFRPFRYGTLTKNGRTRTEWHWKGWGENRPLYGLCDLLARPDAPVLVVEGEKKVDAARRLFPDHVAVSPMNGARSPHKTDWTPLAQRAVVIWPDNDMPGLGFADAVSGLAANASASSVAIIDVSQDWPEGWDLADELPNGVTHEVLAEMLTSAKQRIPPATSSGNGLDREVRPKRRLTALTAWELLTMEIPEREMLLAPVLPGKGLVMIYSKRGVGKTFVGLCIAYAVASGGAYLRWTAPKPRRVLVVDGEMPLITLQQRLATIAFSSAVEPPSPDYIRIIAADYQENGIPDLCTKEGVQAIEEHIADGVDLVVVDNLSTLCRAGKENEGDSWTPIQEWALDLRRRGISVLFVHHAGKGGAQRGTSKREDVLDTVIVLQHPDDYSPADGARFEVHLEKARGVHGDQAKPFEARLEIRNDAMTWTMRDLEDVDARRAVDLKRDGLSVRDIGAEMGISKSKADRLLKKAREMGLADE